MKVFVISAVGMTGMMRSMALLGLVLPRFRMCGHKLVMHCLTELGPLGRSSLAPSGQTGQ